MWRHVLKKAYELTIQRWIVSATLLTLPGHYFAIVTYLGNDIGLSNAEGVPNFWGILVFFILYVFSLLITGIKIYGEHTELQAAKSSEKVLTRVLSAVNDGVRTKAARFRRRIQESDPSENEGTFQAITQPIDQFRYHLSSLSSCLSEVFEIDGNDIGLSIVSRFSRDEEWQLEEYQNIPENIDINQIIQRSYSTLYNVIKRDRNKLILPSKKEGREEGLYCYDGRDESSDGDGSIYCRNISIQEGDHYIGIVLSISTYEEKMFEKGDERARDNLKKITEPFEDRIKLECMLYYLKKIGR
mgnify:CR=1 FL=1